MPKSIAELRILPAFAIGRLGSSPNPMDNYDFVLSDAAAVRQIVAADTLVVDADSGTVTIKEMPFHVDFRDADGRIRPVSPFLEVWARLDRDNDLVPLTTTLLGEAGLRVSDLQWNVEVANNKAFRRTGDVNDKIIARTESFNDFVRHPLTGRCNNFLKDAVIPLGVVQFIQPSTAFPEIRLRFIPAEGKVYGPPSDSGEPDLNIAEAVYDPTKSWKGYFDPPAPTNADTTLGMRRATNPAAIYANVTNAQDAPVSLGYLDDECDGIATVALDTGGGRLLHAAARIAAGPPTFAPDSFPVRTIADELEQAMFGPDCVDPLTVAEVEDVRAIVRSALDTVRLMNTAQMNKASAQRGVGMARMDFLDVARWLEPIVDPVLADNLAIRARHERVMLALTSGSLAWFARALRAYDEVGDLSNDARRRMPAFMRGADGRHLALTQRQLSKVRAAASLLTRAATEKFHE